MFCKVFHTVSQGSRGHCPLVGALLGLAVVASSFLGTEQGKVFHWAVIKLSFVVCLFVCPRVLL